MLQRHGAILDEGDRFALLLHRHHDVEAGGAQFGDRRLQLQIGHRHDAALVIAAAAEAVAEIAHHVLQRRDAGVVLLRRIGEFDQQQRRGIALDEGLQRRHEHVDAAGEPDHGRIHQLDRGRLQGDDVLGRLHRRAEGREVAGAEDLGRLGQRRQPDLDGGGNAQRAFRADQQMGEVDRIVGGHQRVEIVAADPALHLGEARRDLAGLAAAQRQHGGDEFARRLVGGVLVELGEAAGGAVGKDRVDGDDVVAHRAVAQRARAAGIVAGHAADGGARRGGDVDGKPQAVRLQEPVEIVEDDARLDHRATARDVQLQELVEMLRRVDDQAGIDRLAALRRAAAAHGQRQPLLAAGVERRRHVVAGAGDDHAGGHDLVDRGVGGVTPAVEAVEIYVAGNFPLKPAAQARPDHFPHLCGPLPAAICRMPLDTHNEFIIQLDLKTGTSARACDEETDRRTKRRGPRETPS